MPSRSGAPFSVTLERFQITALSRPRALLNVDIEI